MKILLVSNLYDIRYEHYLLNLLFCEGLQYYHLRKENYTEVEMRKYIERIPHYFHERIIIHSHFHLLEEYGLKGVHFTKQNIKKHLNYKFDAPIPHGHMSFSLHSIREIPRLKIPFNYIFLSPVFDSISNKGYNSKFKPEELKIFLKEYQNRPEIIALSGIDYNSFVKAMELGFDGAAFLGYIWTDFEADQDIIIAVKKFNRIQSALEQHQIKQNDTFVS